MPQATDFGVTRRRSDDRCSAPAGIPTRSPRDALTDLAELDARALRSNSAPEEAIRSLMRAGRAYHRRLSS